MSNEGKAEGGPMDGQTINHPGLTFRCREGRYILDSDQSWHWEQTPVDNDPTNPTHYRQGSIECINAIEAATAELTGEEAYCTGCAIKYLWPWKRKGGHDDLRKARWYLNRIIGD